MTNFLSRPGLAVVACSLSLFACKQPTNHQQVAAIAPVAEVIRVEPFAIDSGWGYTIVINNKPFIKQDCIPAIAGHQVFKTKEDAQKIGNWVANRICRNERMNIDSTQLQLLGVLAK